MHPILFRIPLGWDLPFVGHVDAIPIYSYGVMLGLSLVVGWYLTLGLAEREGLPRETMANNYVVTALAAVVMSRVLYIVTNLDEFHSLGDVLSMRRGGLVAYGGFIGGYLGSWFYLKRKNIRLMPWADVAVPSLASGLAITRIGCYLFGCDYGRPLAESAPAWLKKLGTFPRWDDSLMPAGSGSPAWVEHVRERGLDPLSDHSLPVHPTQIYESLVGLMLLVLLLWARKRQRFRGQIFFLFTFAYGVCRFLLEIIRDDPERGNVPWAVAEHLLVPGCLVLFAIGWVVGFSRMIASDALRKASWGLAFVPALVAAVMLRPEEFAAPHLVPLSTSQVIALASGLAVAVAYVLFDNAASAHPEAAMALGIDGAVVTDDEGDEAPKPKKASKPIKKGDAPPKPKKAARDEEELDGEDDDPDADEAGADADADPDA
ncbi:MAG: prolipoprotein diacylglyceryl transferase, partial [Myxococcales bacterium]|nr:prolipoprotein diacylglyceryl transferase [Myxococcales bacterium]